MNILKTKEKAIIGDKTDYWFDPYKNKVITLKDYAEYNGEIIYSYYFFQKGYMYIPVGCIKLSSFKREDAEIKITRRSKPISIEEYRQNLMLYYNRNVEELKEVVAVINFHEQQYIIQLNIDEIIDFYDRVVFEMYGSGEVNRLEKQLEKYNIQKIEKEYLNDYLDKDTFVFFSNIKNETLAYTFCDVRQMVIENHERIFAPLDHKYSPQKYILVKRGGEYYWAEKDFMGLVINAIAVKEDLGITIRLGKKCVEVLYLFSVPINIDTESWYWAKDVPKDFPFLALYNDFIPLAELQDLDSLERKIKTQAHNCLEEDAACWVKKKY